MRSILLASLLVGLTTGSAFADVVTCQVHSKSKNLADRLGDQLVVRFDPSTRVVRVDDGYPDPEVLPHRGKRAKDTERILAFTWKQPRPSRSKAEHHFPGAASFRIAIQRRSGKAILTGISQFQNNIGYSARAKCTINSKE